MACRYWKILRNLIGKILLVRENIIKKYYIYFCAIIFFSLTFSLTNIKIKSPRSKAKLKIGSIHTIKWKPYNKSNSQDKVKIFVSSDSGIKWDLIAITENDGQYNWEVSSIKSEKCLIKIENFDGSSRGVSKKPFSIDGPFIDITYPTENIVFGAGQKAKITWKSNKIGNELINIYLYKLVSKQYS